MAAQVSFAATVVKRLIRDVSVSIDGGFSLSYKKGLIIQISRPEALWVAANPAKAIVDGH